MSNDQQQQSVSQQFDAGDLLEKAKTHRIIISSAEGKPWINLTVLVAVILTLIMPELAALLVVVALLKGGKIEVVSPPEGEKIKNDHRDVIV